MNSRELIRHPGKELAYRSTSAFGSVSNHAVTLPAGSQLLPAVSTLMDNSGCESGILVLDGAQLGPFNYVMPDHSNDGIHAAWYSNTQTCNAAKVRNATAIIGKRDGKWWLHCHALWEIENTTENITENAAGMGHLLPDEVTISNDVNVTLYAFNGGSFDVQHDPETAFPLFHVLGGTDTGNAFIAKIYPHEDIVTIIEQLILKSGYNGAALFGIGSLIGTRFESSEPMLCPISEVLIGSGAVWCDKTLTLPMHCVDVNGQLFYGNVLKGSAPVTVTFELMVVEQKSS